MKLCDIGSTITIHCIKKNLNSFHIRFTILRKSSADMIFQNKSRKQNKLINIDLLRQVDAFIPHLSLFSVHRSACRSLTLNRTTCRQCIIRRSRHPRRQIRHASKIGVTFDGASASVCQCSLINWHNVLRRESILFPAASQ